MRPRWNTATLKTERKIQEYANLFGCKFGHYIEAKDRSWREGKSKVLEISYANKSPLPRLPLCTRTCFLQRVFCSETGQEVYEALDSLCGFIWEPAGAQTLGKSHGLCNQWFHLYWFLHTARISVFIPIPWMSDSQSPLFSLPVSKSVPRNVTHKYSSHPTVSLTLS